jgi:hypothetical protein
MKDKQKELLVVGAIIAYIAFFTHPAPSHISNLLESPVGHGFFLIAILYVFMYHSQIIALFLGIAYIMTARSVTEYLDPKEQTPATEEKKTTSAGVPPPATTDAIKNMLKKGDTRLPQKAGKSETTKPAEPTPPKGSMPKTLNSKVKEQFANF